MIGYLAGFSFLAAVGWGALFFVLLAGLVEARWLEALYPPLLALSGIVVVLPVLFIPVAITARQLFSWEQLRGEVSAPAWGIRSAAVLLVLAGIALRVRHTRRRARGWHAAVGMLLLFFASMFGAFDWIMELAPHFHSTVFGAIVIASGVVAALGISTAVQARDAPDVCADFGTMLFAATMFWGYVSFAELLIVWIADLPHEVEYYRARAHGPWPWVGGFLVVGALALTMFLLLFRALKEQPARVAAVGAWAAFGQIVDAVWLVVPSRPGGIVATALGFAASLVVGAALIAALLANRRGLPAERGDAGANP